MKEISRREFLGLPNRENREEGKEAPVVITELSKPVIVRFSGDKVVLPGEVGDKIDAYWNEILKSGKKYTRGEIFSVVRKDEGENSVEVLVEKTDYAHYLYTQNRGGLEAHGTTVIHPAAIVVTKDQYAIFGQMGSHTGRADIMQLAGGAFDIHDLREDTFDLDHNIRREMQEELELNIDDGTRVAHCAPTYFKDGGRNKTMVIIYQIDLRESAAEFEQKYETFVKKQMAAGHTPELQKIIALPLEKKALGDFFTANECFCDENLRPLLKTIVEAQ